MKIVIDVAYGGFSLPENFAEERGISIWDDYDRTATDLIQYVEEHLDETSLRVVEIPDEATDYYINEYDGLENVIFVLDGKIRFA